MVRKKLLVFSGAGMSAESGISTFRDANGLWENYAIEDVATPQAWKNNAEKVQHFYNFRRKQIVETNPNSAHRVVAELERDFDVQVVTQNIDDLHERAGSTKVLHLHGNIRLAKSSGPNAEKKYYPIAGWELKMTDICDEGFTLRPHVVWFGEEVPMLERAANFISEAEIIIVIGTSLNVYPAAGLIHLASSAASKIIIDPKANELQIPPDFEIINLGAGDGLNYWKQKMET
jgi:NAD-dependent deacetylase